MLVLAAASTAQAHPTRIPPRCTTRLAPRLCSIHYHHRRADTYRTRAGLTRLRYGWKAERYPQLRDWLLTYWIRVQVRSEAYLDRVQQRRASLPWLSQPFYGQAMCIHRYESINWHDPGSPGGGLQFMQGTWDNSVVRGYQFASTPGGATPGQQLEAAYRLVRYDGNWHEWTTAPLCGL